VDLEPRVETHRGQFCVGRGREEKTRKGLTERSKKKRGKRDQEIANRRNIDREEKREPS